jgi:hypothetical protein
MAGFFVLHVCMAAVLLTPISSFGNEPARGDAARPDQLPP